MENILTIEEGKYELNSSVSVGLDSPLSFNFGTNYLLVGDNGIGKSSFITKLLLPKMLPIAEDNYLVIYIPQDVTIQYYLIKYYYNGLLNEQHNFSTIADALYLVKSKILNYKKFPTDKIVFVLDEIDQYLPLVEFLKDLDKSTYSIFLITHNEKNLPESIKCRHLFFEKIDPENTNIRMEE